MAVLTEEQTMLRDRAREWADNESPVAAFRKMRDAAPAELFDAQAWQAQAEMGWAGILVPEAHGRGDGISVARDGDRTARPHADRDAAGGNRGGGQRDRAARIGGAEGRMAVENRFGRSHCDAGGG